MCLNWCFNKDGEEHGPRLRIPQTSAWRTYEQVLLLADHVGLTGCDLGYQSLIRQILQLKIIKYLSIICNDWTCFINMSVASSSSSSRIRPYLVRSVLLKSILVLPSLLWTSCFSSSEDSECNFFFTRLGCQPNANPQVCSKGIQMSMLITGQVIQNSAVLDRHETGPDSTFLWCSKCSKLKLLLYVDLIGTPKREFPSNSRSVYYFVCAHNILPTTSEKQKISKGLYFL
jgi:hypothetical protein